MAQNALNYLLRGGFWAQLKRGGLSRHKLIAFETEQKGTGRQTGVSCDFSGHRTKTDLPPNEGLKGEGEKSRGNPPHEGGVRVQTYNSDEGRAVPRTTPPLEADAAKPSWLASTDVEVLDHK